MVLKLKDRVLKGTDFFFFYPLGVKSLSTDSSVSGGASAVV